MDQARLSLLALHFIPGIGDYLIRQVISYCGSPDAVFKTPRGKLLKIPGIGVVTAEAIVKGSPFKFAEQEIEKAKKQDVELVFFLDKNYPKRLKGLVDAPTLLYLKGNVDLENPKTVGIVGTRKSTEYGKLCVEELVAGLVPHDALVISGLAYGIDIWAHRECLHYNLATAGILGSGIDVMYPAQHRETALKMQEHGALITENPFGTKPDAHNFPARNRIIAGLSDALVVIEAGDRGGALITAEIANSYNKDVFAFPGNIGRSYSIGCNNLIKSNKANLITSVKDLEYIMDWTPGENRKDVKSLASLEGLDDNEQLVFKTLEQHDGVLVIDDLSWKTALPLSKLAGTLLTMEFKGLVCSLPGKRYKLK